MKIKIIDNDIKKGTPDDCNNCAISQALKRYFKTPRTCTEVDGGDIVLTVNNKKYMVGQKYENDVLDFIFDFDKAMYDCIYDCIYDLPEPIEFEITEIPISEQKG